MDANTTIEDLKVLVAHFRDERDWRQFHNPKDLAISISIEANELLELFQWKSAEEADSLLSDPDKRRLVEDEMADIVIYCMSAADGLGVDMSDAIRRKLDENARKYPVSKSRGRADKYTEL